MTFSTPSGARATSSPSDDRRLDLLTAWLRPYAGRYGLDVASLAPASSDASFRRYFRLAASGEHGASLIAVDAPPPEKCREFAQVGIRAMFRKRSYCIGVSVIRREHQQAVAFLVAKIRRHAFLDHGSERGSVAASCEVEDFACHFDEIRVDFGRGLWRCG